MKYTKTMNVMGIREDKPDGEFEIVSVQMPQCPADGVLVKNEFVGINRGDVIRRGRGMFGSDPELPIVLGFEGVGEVAEVAAGVSGWTVGDRCGYLTTRGAFAEFTPVSQSELVALPADVAPEKLATSICIGLTASGLLEKAMTPPGEAVLVQGGTGSVAQALVALALRRHLPVIVTVSNIDRATDLLRPGVSAVELTSPTLGAEIDAITSGRGVATVFDGVGQASMESSFAAIRPGGRLLYYGSASGHAEFPGLDILMNHLIVQGFVVFECSKEPELWQSMIGEFGAAMSAGELVPRTTVVEPRDMLKVFRAIESREARGRYVIDVRELGRAV